MFFYFAILTFKEGKRNSIAYCDSVKERWKATFSVLMEVIEYIPCE